MIEVGIMPYKQDFRAGGREEAGERDEGLLNLGAVGLLVLITVQEADALAHSGGRRSDVRLAMQGDVGTYFKLIIVAAENQNKFTKCG